MKAILTYSTTTMIGGERAEYTKLFDTEKAKKICGIKNGFGYETKEIYITEKETIFTYDTNYKRIEVPEQKIINGSARTNQTYI